MEGQASFVGGFAAIEPAPGSSLMRDEDASPQDQVSASIEPIPGGSSVSAGPSDINGGFPCRLVGWRAADAISYLSRDNVTVEWAFESPTDSEGVGYRSTPESVPLNSIIMDVSSIDAGTVVVGVHGAQDLTHGEMPRTKRKDSEC